MLFVRKKIYLLTALLLLFTYYLSAQQKMTNYTILWKKIDSLATKKGLTQSALEEVNKIYALAKKEKQDAQLIKAFIYQISLQEIKEENADTKSIAALENEIRTATERLNPYSIQYWQKNTGIIFNSTATSCMIAQKQPILKKKTLPAGALMIFIKKLQRCF